MSHDDSEKPKQPVTKVACLSPSVAQALRQINSIPKSTWSTIAQQRHDASATASAIRSLLQQRSTRDSLNRAVREITEQRKSLVTASAIQSLTQQKSALHKAIQSIATNQQALRRSIDMHGAGYRLLKDVELSRGGWLRLLENAGSVQQLGRLDGAWNNGLASFQRVIAEVFKSGTRNKLILAAGWLPHASTGIGPDELPEAEGLRERIEQHYRENWGTISEELTASLGDLLIDEEAKACFREALDAHGHGFYRCVVRTLLPEIERVARVYFGVPVDHGLPRDKKAISRLKDALGDLPLSVLGGANGSRTASLGKFLQGVYRNINSPEDVEKARADHIPNRHASIHGIVSYGSYQHSINAITMTQLVFALLTEYQHMTIAEEALEKAS